MTAWKDPSAPSPDVIRDCVHCGFCLPTCPTYVVLGEEMDSPRGRIVLMRDGHEEASELGDALTLHLDRCLGCMACVTACPSGVRYDALIESARPQVEAARPRPARLARRVAVGAMTRPGLMRAALPFAKLGPLRPRVPLRAALHRLPELTPARGERRGSVALLQGCVQRAWFGAVNAAAARVLAAEGFDVHAPRAPRCCGALAHHAGVPGPPRPAFSGHDVVLTTAAGCGSYLKESDARTRDILEFLAGIEPRAPRGPVALRVAYHDACHLAHAQGIRAEPRALLRAIPELELLEPAEWELCCGSAGTYNLTQPRIAADLGRRKARNLEAVRPDVVAAANPGCAVQIGAHSALAVVHPVELLDRSLQAGARG